MIGIVAKTVAVAAGSVGIGGLAVVGVAQAEEAGSGLRERMVQAGLHGRKTGRGFYDYASEPPTPVSGLV